MSVIEVLAGTLCLSILLAMSYAFARSAFTSVRVQDAKADAQEGTLMAVDLLTRELRMAGYSATGAPITGVRGADPERVEVATDFDGDGDSDETNELVAFSYNAEKRQLVRSTGGASPQPFVRNVPPGGLRFAFFDADGAEMLSPAGGMSLAERRRIHRIDVVLRTESPADPAGASPAVSIVSTSICLRNQ